MAASRPDMSDDVAPPPFKKERQLTEEEEMEAAIAASLGSTPAASSGAESDTVGSESQTVRSMMLLYVSTACRFRRVDVMTATAWSKSRRFCRLRRQSGFRPSLQRAVES